MNHWQWADFCDEPWESEVEMLGRSSIKPSSVEDAIRVAEKENKEELNSKRRSCRYGDG